MTRGSDQDTERESACAGGMLWGGELISAGGGGSDDDSTVRRGRSRQSEVRQKGLTKSEGCEESGGKASLERGWKGLGWAKRES